MTFDAYSAAGCALVAGLLLLAFSIRRHAVVGGYAFTTCIFAGVAAALFFPQHFSAWRGYKLSGLIVPLIQIIMFGMGTTLSVADFARVLLVPRSVIIGVILHFGIMPTTGFLLTRLFGFQGELAAGIVLVGAMPSGVASNVITYLAGGNVPLSVTITAVSTLMSPFLSPLAVKYFAGQYVPISALQMMVEILKMIVLPIIAGLVANRLFLQRMRWLDRVLPIVSMAAICIIITIITSLSRDKLLSVAFALVAVVMLHNTAGYLLGYWSARLVGMVEADARTVAIEVGLQNAGMASGLAISVLHSSDAGLAAAIFGPWMNISGSALASWWRRRPATGRPSEAAVAVSGGGQR
jgi:BASS family bile acid:Na+ symporter